MFKDPARVRVLASVIFRQAAILSSVGQCTLVATWKGSAPLQLWQKEEWLNVSCQRCGNTITTYVTWTFKLGNHLPAQHILWGSWRWPRGRGPHHSGRCLCGWAPCSWERWAVENKEGGSTINVCCNWVWPVVAPYRTPQCYFEREREKEQEREGHISTWKLTLAPPADCPKTVMLSGSPPKARMFLCTQAIPACWSHKP